MAPNKTPEKRAKLRTVDEINNEMRRNYRLSINKKITLAESQRRNASLAPLRNGMADPVEKPKASSHTPLAIHVLSVSGYFLSAEQIAKVQRGEDIVDLKECAPMQFDEPVTSLPAPAPQLAPPEQYEAPAAPSEPVLSPAMQRAREMGYVPLPPRIRLVD